MKSNKGNSIPVVAVLSLVIVGSLLYFGSFWYGVFTDSADSQSEEVLSLDALQNRVPQTPEVAKEADVVEEDIVENENSEDSNDTENIEINLDGEKPSVTYYYGDTCPYCNDVSDYIDENNLEQLISIERKEIYNNQANQREFQETAENCGVERRGVPFLVSEGECFIGLPSISEEFDRLVENIQ